MTTVIDIGWVWYVSSLNAIVQAPIAGVRVALVRTEAGTDLRYTLLVARDQAEYLWDSLLLIGAPHRLTPVGAKAIGAVR